MTNVELELPSVQQPRLVTVVQIPVPVVSNESKYFLKAQLFGSKLPFEDTWCRFPSPTSAKPRALSLRVVVFAGNFGNMTREIKLTSGCPRCSEAIFLHLQFWKSGKCLPWQSPLPWQPKPPWQSPPPWLSPERDVPTRPPHQRPCAPVRCAGPS